MKVKQDINQEIVGAKHKQEIISGIADERDFIQLKLGPAIKVENHPPIDTRTFAAASLTSRSTSL